LSRHIAAIHTAPVARAGRGPDRYLTTVLFTDIVGSTERAAELGDRAWRDLVEQHHELIRRELRRFGGREVDTAGDGFFAVFDAPARAVACALVIVEAVRTLGLEVRAGVHTGEVEGAGSKVRGIAVHIGARIGASAAPGEVLVSATVRDLVAGSAIDFTDLGARELKGVSGEWRVFAGHPGSRFAGEFATARQDSGREVAAVRRSIEQRTRRRRYAVVGAVVLAIALVGGAVYVATRPPPSLPAVDANSAGVIDPVSGRIVAEVPLATGPGSIAYGDGAIWVTNATDGTVVRIDPARRAVVQTIEVGASPRGLAVDAGSVWVANSDDRTVSRVNVAANRVVQTTQVGGGSSGVALGAGSVWVANETDGTVTRIDGSTGKVVATYELSGSPGAIAADDTAVWVATFDTNTLTRLDPSTGHVVASITVGNGPRAVAVGQGAVWVANGLDGTVSRVDPSSGTITSTVQVGEGPAALVTTPGAVWVASSLEGVVYRIDPTSSAVMRVPVGASPTGLAQAPDGLWVAAGASKASHRGGTLRIVGAQGLDALDPAVGYSIETWLLLGLTNDGLVAFERTGGVAGARIVPDLAVSVPRPTDGGKTYTFQLRQGITYSDGQPVVASDLRRAFQRLFSVPRNEGEALPIPLSIVGMDGCAEHFGSPCDLSKGIVTDDATGTVTFELAAPDPDFLAKLALPMADAVPASVGPQNIGTTAVPATGAYMFASITDKDIRLVRNPRFHEWSRLARPDGYPDEIVFTIGATPDEQIQMIIAGTAQASMGGGGNRPTPERLDQLRLQYPGILHGWVAGTIALHMDTSKAPFDSVDVRRAVAFAVDRNRVVDLLGGQTAADVTCQMMPPTLPGSRPYCPYTLDPDPGGRWTAPDMTAARALVAKSGKAGARVRIATYGPFGDTTAYIVQVLAELGFDAKVLDDSGDPSSPPEFEAALTGWVPDYPASSAAIIPIFGCDQGPNLAHFCDPSVDAAIDRAVELQETDPAAAGTAWAAVDRAIVDLAPAAAFAHRRNFDIVSSSVGNYQHNPEWTILFDQLWVQ
jgi:YVTN family beta-propeller protein